MVSEFHLLKSSILEYKIFSHKFIQIETITLRFSILISDFPMLLPMTDVLQK